MVAMNIDVFKELEERDKLVEEFVIASDKRHLPAVVTSKTHCQALATQTIHRCSKRENGSLQ